jgi:hypothetical protein
VSDTIWAALSGAVIIAILFVLVKPGSTAAASVTATGGAIADLLKLAVS